MAVNDVDAVIAALRVVLNEAETRRAEHWWKIYTSSTSGSISYQERGGVGGGNCSCAQIAEALLSDKT
jgi:hypothetical protein